jgi:hypothetical protein
MINLIACGNADLLKKIGSALHRVTLARQRRSFWGNSPTEDTSMTRKKIAKETKPSAPRCGVHRVAPTLVIFVHDPASVFVDHLLLKAVFRLGIDLCLSVAGEA